MIDKALIDKTRAMGKSEVSGPTIITQKPITTKTLEDVLATESGYIEMLSEPQIVFDDYQREFLESLERFQIWLKGRQLGFSFVSAARALARSQNLDDYTCIISSYKTEDSKEKSGCCGLPFNGILIRSMQQQILGRFLICRQGGEGVGYTNIRDT